MFTRLARWWTDLFESPRLWADRMVEADERIAAQRRRDGLSR